MVEVETGGRLEEAYLPNPGRLWELLLPDTELLLSRDLSGGRLPYTVLACLKDGRWVLLHTHLTNKVVRALIDEGRIGFYADYRVTREEPACGRHRFDLLLEHVQTGDPYYLEIKSCTLFAGRVAMFPDAVTRRGAEHLYRLRELAAEGIKGGCLFAVMNPEADYFLPAYHIDGNFARAVTAVKNEVPLDAVALGFDPAFSEVETVKPLVVPLDFLTAELQDRGAYLLLIKLEAPKTLAVGSLGQIRFERGFYIYVGSAMKGLGQRIARHLRKKKRHRWHVDYLTAEAISITPVPIISGLRLECALAGSLRQIAGGTVKGFGSSDCRCEGHLFYYPQNPLHDPRFIKLIQDYRIRRLEPQLDARV